MLCEADCAKDLAGASRVTTPSGLQYQDIVVGTGPSPVVGFQVCACSALLLLQCSVALRLVWHSRPQSGWQRVW